MQVRSVEHSGHCAFGVHQAFAVHHGGDQFALANHLIPLNANATGNRVAADACAQLVAVNDDVAARDVIRCPVVVDPERRVAATWGNSVSHRKVHTVFNANETVGTCDPVSNNAKVLALKNLAKRSFSVHQPFAEHLGAGEWASERDRPRPHIRPHRHVSAGREGVAANGCGEAPVRVVDAAALNVEDGAGERVAGHELGERLAEEEAAEHLREGDAPLAHLRSRSVRRWGAGVIRSGADRRGWVDRPEEAERHEGGEESLTHL